MKHRDDITPSASRPTVHYVPVNQVSPYAMYDPATIAHKQAEQRRLYAQWKIRHREQVAREAANRRIMWRIVAVAGAVGLALVGVTVWQLVELVAHHGTEIAAGGGVLALALVGVGLVGTGTCVTIVKHYHR